MADFNELLIQAYRLPSRFDQMERPSERTAGLMGVNTQASLGFAQ
jgi:hypothetical protein